MRIAVKNIDEYIASQEPQARPGIETIRQIVKKVVPEAQELISYGMPAFKYLGKVLIYFSAAKNHIGLYPGNASTFLLFKEELKDYSTSTGTIRFPIGQPIPEKLVEKIVKKRVEENLIKSLEKKKK